METSVSTPAWQRAALPPAVYHSQSYKTFTDRDRLSGEGIPFRTSISSQHYNKPTPGSSETSYSSAAGYDGEIIKRGQHFERPEAHVPGISWSRRYHEHDEDMTDFRSSANDYVPEYRNAGTVLSSADHAFIRTGTCSDSRADSNQEHDWGEIPQDTKGSSSSYADTFLPAGISDEDYPLNRDDVEGDFGLHSYSSHTWHKQYEDNAEGMDVPPSTGDWKQPDIHLFKTSSHKGSVTSEKSSRLDPHTYQSYTAGLLYSSGRSEKFLKLQKHFAVLERIGELDKSTHVQPELSASRWKGFGNSGPDFQSKEELQELYSELKEAKKNKEFFHDTEKTQQMQWSPEKDFGLVRQERTINDKVRMYRDLTSSEKSPSSAPAAASRQEEIKRAVSFGSLYQKFSSSDVSDRGKEEAENKKTRERARDLFEESTRTRDSMNSSLSKVQGNEQSGVGDSTTPRDPSAKSRSYLQVMENAAKKSRQRAIYGTHSDPSRNDYEQYVEEIKKITREEAAAAAVQIKPVSAPQPSRNFLAKTSAESALKSSCSTKTLNAGEPYNGSNSYSLKKQSAPLEISPEIIVDSSSVPKLALKVKGVDEQVRRQDPEIQQQVYERQGAPEPESNAWRATTRTNMGYHQPERMADASSYPTQSSRRNFSEMPDIIQMEKHCDHGRLSPENTSDPDPSLQTSWLESQAQQKHHDHERLSPANTASPSLQTWLESRTPAQHLDLHSTSFGLDDSVGPFNPGNPVESSRFDTGESQQKIPPGPNKKGIFCVKDLRNLATDNEFSSGQPAWMKRASVISANRDNENGLKGKPFVVPDPPQRFVIQRTGSGPEKGSSTQFHLPKASVSGESVTRGQNDLIQHAVPLYKQSASSPSMSSSNSGTAAKTPPAVPSKKPTSLLFRPTPSQTAPSFSATVRGKEPRTRQNDNANYANIIYENTPSQGRDLQHSTTSQQRNAERPSGKLLEDRSRQTGIVFANAPEQDKGEYVGEDFSHERPQQDPVSGEDSAGARGPGDGKDWQSDGPGSQYGQLRKWTAVADIYRDVEKSWSPTREARPFPVENNSSISSTDTFIVKNTDEEDNGQDDLENSSSSVSQLRAMFERRQKMSKSKSEPDMSVDSSDEPRRPRSAKSQTNLNKEERSNPPKIPRTVSGDLADLRLHYDDREESAQPDQSGPTDVALKAWVEYTGRQKYDPYLPPEDILKEVSAATSGRKLDIPKKKTYRPSNVSRMTLEYLDQIGSEWQQSNRGVPLISGRPPQATVNNQGQLSIGSSAAQAGPQPFNRRYLSHQYVNEQSPFASCYPQTDDLKLRQSQWIGSSNFAGGSAPSRPAYTGKDESQVYAVPYTKTPSAQTVEKIATRLPQSQPSLTPLTQSRPQLSRQSKPSEPSPQPSAKWKPPQTTNSKDSPVHVNKEKKDSKSRAEEQSLTKSSPQAGLSHQNYSSSVPPEPSRPPPKSPQSVPRAAPRRLQHAHSKSSDSDRSSGDYSAVYCVSTGSVWYGTDADEATEPPMPPRPQSPSSLVASSATFPRKLAPRHQQGRSPASPPHPALGPSAPVPPARGGGVGSRGTQGAGTLPRAKPRTSLGSSWSAVEQLGVKSPPPSVGFGSAVSAGAGTARPSGSAHPSPSSSASAFKHQTTDAQRPRPEPVNPEKERRRKQEEEAYRKKRLEELYEEERLKKKMKDEADAEARRHHDFYMNAQKSPISPNRFDDAPTSLSPSQPGSLGTLERKDQALSVPPERRRGFQIQGKARALFNFTAQNPRELSFRKNDILYLLRQVDNNWFEGERHGMVGIFPTNYVEVVTSIEAAQAAAMQAEGQGRAKYNFTAQSSVELSLRKGEFVVLLRRVDENWYEGRIGNRQGIFPVSYVEITREPSTPLITPAPSVITTPMTGTPEMLSPVGYDPAPTPPPQPSPSAFTSQRSPSAPYGFRQPQQPGFSPSSAPLLAPATSVSRQQISLSRQEQDLARSPMSPGRLGSPGQGKATSPGLSPGPSAAPLSKLQVDIHSKAKPFANGQPPASKVMDDDLALTRYRALYAYRPQNEDELELREGDEVFVMEKCDDGWFVGTSARTGCFGTFPGNYVQKIQLVYENKSVD